MKNSLVLSVVLATLLGTVATAQAQTVSREAGKAKEEKEAEQNNRARHSAQTPLFPNATRVEPKQGGSPSESKSLGAIYALYQSKKYDDALAKADAVIADPKASAFARSQAAYMAGFAALDKNGEDYTQAIGYLKRALSEGGLNNNNHYQTMLQAAQMLAADEKAAEALPLVEQFLSETHSTDAKNLVLKANIQYQLQKFADSAETLKPLVTGSAAPDDSAVKLLIADYMEMDKPQDAAAMLEQLVAKNPKDKTMQQNLIAAYQQSDQDAKAAQVVDRMRAAGLMTESKDYEYAYRLLANVEGREKDAVALINEGLDKNILTPNYDVYAFLGTAYYNTDQTAKAVEAWTKAAPLGKDGEMYLNVAKLQAGEDHNADAIANAKLALDKGLKKPGEAWVVIGNANLASNNKPAALAAFREAAKYPETKKQAEAVLRQAGGK